MEIETEVEGIRLRRFGGYAACERAGALSL